jgi:hypothetical protein
MSGHVRSEGVINDKHCMGVCVRFEDCILYSASRFALSGHWNGMA